MENNQLSNGAGSGSGTGSGVHVIGGPPIADMLAQLEDYSPTIPDSVTQHYLSTAGVQTDDPRIVRLVALAAQKFVSDVANDALQHCKMRVHSQQQQQQQPQSGGQSGGGKKPNNPNEKKKFVMTTEDLSLALADQGVTLKKPPYYV